MGGGAVSLSAWFGTIYSRTACFAGLAHFVRSMGRGVEAAQIAPSPSARSLQLVARSGVVSRRKGRYGFCPLLVGLVGFHVGPSCKGGSLSYFGPRIFGQGLRQNLLVGCSGGQLDWRLGYYSSPPFAQGSWVGSSCACCLHSSLAITMNFVLFSSIITASQDVKGLKVFV